MPIDSDGGLHWRTQRRSAAAILIAALSNFNRALDRGNAKSQSPDPKRQEYELWRRCQCWTAHLTETFITCHTMYAVQICNWHQVFQIGCYTNESLKAETMPLSSIMRRRIGTRVKVSTFNIKGGSALAAEASTKRYARHGTSNGITRMPRPPDQTTWPDHLTRPPDLTTWPDHLTRPPDLTGIDNDDWQTSQFW